MKKIRSLKKFMGPLGDTWEVLVKTNLSHPLLKQVCFEQKFKNSQCETNSHVVFYTVKTSRVIRSFSGHWHTSLSGNKSQHTNIPVELASLKEMIEIAEKELLKR